MNTSALIQKVWTLCHTRRDDGVGYGDYLKMARIRAERAARASSAKAKKPKSSLTRSSPC
jgi:hypothetical protein